MEQKLSLPNPIEKVKSILTCGRELLLLGIILVCILRPTSIPQWLCTAGLKEVKAFDVSVAPECIAKREARDELNSVNAADLANKTVEQKISQPVSQQVVAAIAQAQQFAPKALPTTGWIFLGKTDQTKTKWLNGQPQTIEHVDLPIQKGMHISIRDDVYLRAAVPANTFKSMGKIISVIRVGESVKVEKIELTEATERDGFLVWALIQSVR